MERELERGTLLPSPDRDRAGALIALILLAYGLIRIIELPSRALEFELFGLLLRIEFDARFVMLSMAGALAATGIDWILASHPLGRSVGFEPRVLPGMAALGAGAILAARPVGPAWLIGLGLAGLLLYVVIYGEFVVFDPDDPRAGTAGLGLRTLGVLLIIGVAFAARAGGLRAVYSVPVLFAATGIVCWRLLSLAYVRRSIWPYATTCGWITAQLAWGLHYWPLRAMQAALILGLVTYVSMGLSRAHATGQAGRRTIYEFGGLSMAALAAILLLT